MDAIRIRDLMIIFLLTTFFVGVPVAVVFPVALAVTIPSIITGIIVRRWFATWSSRTRCDSGNSRASISFRCRGDLTTRSGDGNRGAASSDASSVQLDDLIKNRYTGRGGFAAPWRGGHAGDPPAFGTSTFGRLSANDTG